MLKVIERSGAILTKNKDDLPRDQILIEALVLSAFIGVFDHEYKSSQKLRFDITVDVSPLTAEREHDVQNIVRYDLIVADIKAILTKGHIDLVETLAEDVAKVCLSYDRAEQVCVTVAKLSAFDEAASVGVRIIRRK
jgi:dihydroneopterin aldolase